MGLPLLRGRGRPKTPTQNHSWDPGALPESGGRRTWLRTSAALCQPRNLQPGMSDHGRADRSLYRAGAPSLYRRSARRRARQRGPDLFPLRELLPFGTQPLGTPPLGELPGAGFRQAGSAGEYRRMAAFLVVLAEKCQRACAQDRALHLERDEARISSSPSNGGISTKTPWARSASNYRAVQPSARSNQCS
jgi:hypothetical protein